MEKEYVLPAPTEMATSQVVRKQKGHGSGKSTSRFTVQPSLGLVVESYVACEEGELSLEKGEVVTVVATSADCPLYAGSIDGRFGVFPKTCVELTQNLDKSSTVDNSTPLEPPAPLDSPILTRSSETEKLSSGNSLSDLSGGASIESFSFRPASPMRFSEFESSVPATSPISPRFQRIPPLSHVVSPKHSPNPSPRKDLTPPSSPKFGAHRKLTPPSSPRQRVTPPSSPRQKITPPSSPRAKNVGKQSPPPSPRTLNLKKQCSWRPLEKFSNFTLTLSSKKKSRPALPGTFENSESESPKGRRDRITRSDNITPNRPPSIPSTPSTEDKIIMPPLFSETLVDPSLTKKQRTRLEVINEIVSTETTYVEDLDLTIKIFLQPLRETKLVGESVLSKVFSNIEILANLNRRLSNELMELVASHKPQDICIGDVFVKMSDFLKMYMFYCANQPTALSTLEQIKKNSHLKHFLEITITDPRCRGLTLFGFLIKPVQRICKYPLFLKQLQENTDEEHPDYNSIIEARRKLEEVAEYINEGKRLVEALEKIISIQQSVDGCIEVATPTRRFYREGTFTSYTDKGRSKDLHLFLFNDLVLLVTPKHSRRKTSYDFRCAIPLDKARIVVLANNEELANAFELSYEGTRFILSASSEKEKEDWVKELKKIIKEFQLQICEKKLSRDVS